MADLVEYALGGEGTTWGKKRIEHGHPRPYSLKYIELGNEQYNPDWAAQVTAMQHRAEQLGQGESLVYFWPKGACTNAQPNATISLGWPCPNATVVDAVKGLGLGARLAFDAHPDGSRSHNINPAAKELQADVMDDPLFEGWGGGNFETNTGSHDLHHALDEGEDLNTFFNLDEEVQARIWGRAASFCMERAGYNEGGANDQGLIFFNQNQTWAQPGFYVHQMIAETWQPFAVPVNATCGGGASQLSVSAQRSAAAAASDSGNASATTSLALRITNKGTESVRLTLQVLPEAEASESTGAGAAPPMLTLHSMIVLDAPPGGGGLFAVNTGREPERVKPRTVPIRERAHAAVNAHRMQSTRRDTQEVQEQAGTQTVEIPAQSFVVVTAGAAGLR